MKRNRKKVNDLIYSLSSLRERNKFWKNEFIELVGEQGFDQLREIYDNAIDKLTQEKKALPVGYRYTGEFYVKKPYSTPILYEKVNGSAFMREDLISWRIESEDQYKDCCFRAIYRDSGGKESSQIMMDDAKPFYATED